MLLERDRAQEAWSAVRPTLDVERLERGSAALLGLLYERLQEWGSTEPFLPKLKGLYRYIWYGNQIGLRALEDALGTLRHAGVQTIAFGDAALVVAHYRRHGVRPLNQPAVLVPLRWRPEALTALQRNGWAVAGGPSGRSARVVRRGGDRRGVVVHWQLSMELEPLGGPTAERFWWAAQPAQVHGAETSVLAPTDELLRVCVDGARSSSTSRVQWLADALTILGGPRREVDWDRLAEDAIARRCSLRVRDALAYLAGALEAPVPEGTLRELRNAPTTGRERLAHRISGRGGPLLGNVPSTTAAHLVATRDARLVTSLATLPRFVRAEWGVRRRLQLPAAVVRKIAGVVADAWNSRRHHRISAS